MTRRVSLSVIITVYGETQALRETVRRVLANDRGYIHEILLTVAPRSSEDCHAVCRELDAAHDNLRLHIQQQTPGVGYALREAMDLIAGTHAVLLSADLETEPEAVDRMVKVVEETGCDGVIGSRWLPGGRFENYDPFKLYLNWAFQQCFRLLYLTRLSDLTYGYKLLSREICQSIVWTGTLHEIFCETTLKPLRAGFDLRQIATVWIGRTEGVSRNTFWRNFRYVRQAIAIRFRPVARRPMASPSSVSGSAAPADRAV